MPCLSGLNNFALKSILLEAMSQSAFPAQLSFFFYYYLFCLDNASLSIKCCVSAEYLTFMGVRYLLGS